MGCCVYDKNYMHPFERERDPKQQRALAQRQRAPPKPKGIKWRPSVDERALQTPKSAEQSLELLAKYLATDDMTEVEKARAIYIWIISKVKYDREGVKDYSKRLSCESADVLKNRMCACHGYANIMQSLCTLAGLECKFLYGYSKWNGRHHPTKALTTDTAPDHGWNAVKLDGVWYLVEPTWGARPVQNDTIVCDESEIHFLTDPELFVETHFPYMNSDMQASSQWQLLKNPIDLQTFHKRVARSLSCLNYKVKLTSHQNSLIYVKRASRLRFKGLGDPLQNFKANLIDCETGEKCIQSVVTVLDRRSNEATVSVRPPVAGVFYKLQVFGTTKTNTNTSEELVTYYIQSEHPNPLLFPAWGGAYCVKGDPEKFGFKADFPGRNDFWIKVTDGEHELKFPITRPVAATCDLRFSDDASPSKEFTLLQMSDRFLFVRFRLRRAGFYRLTLFCKDRQSETATYSQMASFLLHCMRSDKSVKPYPNSYTFALEHRVMLECPLERDLPANSDVRFRLKTPTVQQLLVKGQVVKEKNGDTFDFIVKTGDPATELNIYGKADATERMFSGLYKFNVVG